MLDDRKRVLIIGCPGAGKSTLAVQLGELTGLPVQHLDAHHWQPGWVALPKQEWHALVRELVDEPRWILDGNYRGTMKLRMDHCDAVVFLDFPSWLCMFRVLWRFLRGRQHPDLPDGCREQLSWEFLRFVWGYRREDTPRVVALLDALPDTVEVIRLEGPADTRRLLDSIAQRSTRRPH